LLHIYSEKLNSFPVLPSPQWRGDYFCLRVGQSARSSNQRPHEEI